jgi:hypothetical protein
MLVRVLAPLLVVAVVLGVYFSGKSSGGPGIPGKATGQQTQASRGAKTTPVDQTKVAALMEKIHCEPQGYCLAPGPRRHLLVRAPKRTTNHTIRLAACQ